MFHYNKMHNQDPENIPPWVLKFKGETRYIHHMEILPGLGFSTKETPDSPHTKAALKVKGRLKLIEYDDRTIEAIVY